MEGYTEGPIQRAGRIARREWEKRVHHAPRVRFAMEQHAERLAASRAGNPGRPVFAIGLVERMGDIVAAEPVARYVRRMAPEAHITWVTSPQNRCLVDFNPHIDTVLTVGCLTEWFELAKSGLFGQVFDLHLPGAECPVCRVPSAKSVTDLGIHVGNYLEFGPLLSGFCLTGGLPALSGQPDVYIPAAARRRVDRLGLPERYAVIHGRSSQVDRNWTGDKWRTLAYRLNRDPGLDLPVIEVGDRPVAADGIANRYRNLCGALGILESAEVIRRASLFVGVDSGPAHIANAARTPGVVILGSYPGVQPYCPYTGGYATGATGTLMRAEGLAARLPVDAVADAARDRVHSPVRLTLSAAI